MPINNIYIYRFWNVLCGLQSKDVAGIVFIRLLMPTNTSNVEDKYLNILKIAFLDSKSFITKLCSYLTIW